MGAVLPPSCNIGEGFFLLTSGSNLYICSSQNVWTAVTAPPVAGTGSEVQTVNGTFPPNAVPAVDNTGTEVSSGCTASSGSMTCAGGFSGGSGASRIIASEGITPQSPSTGQQTLYIDSADHSLKTIDSGNLVRRYATIDGTETLTNKTMINPSVGSSAVTSSFPNEGLTGTTINMLAKLMGAPSTAILTSTTDSSGVAGIVVGGAGTTGLAAIAVSGQANCIFDGAATAGDYVTISSTVAGACHDSGSTYPRGVQVLGRILSSGSAGGTYGLQLFAPETQGTSVASVPASSFDPLDYSTAWWRDEMTNNYQWYVLTDPGAVVVFGDATFGDSAHPGTFQLQTSTSTGNSAKILLAWSNGAQNMHYPENLPWEMRWIAKPYGLGGSAYDFGFRDSAGANLVKITYDASLGGDWFGESVNSGTALTVDLGVPVSTSAWAILRMRSDGINIYFSVNGSAEKTLCASGCDINGDIGLSNTEIWPYAAATNETATWHAIGIDFFALQISGLTR